MQAALNLQDAFGMLLAHGHGLTEILSWTWEQVGFAVLAVAEYEQDRLAIMARTLAPMISGKKPKDAPTPRQARHKAVLDDLRQRRAVRPEEKQALLEATLADMAGMFEVEIEGGDPPKRAR